MVSSKEVAKRAGVSQSTVSRVINNPNSVRKDKREKVLKVMSELNYRPNSIARSLISNKTNQISLISGTLNNPFFIESTKTIINYASQHGYNVNVFFEEDLRSDDLYGSVFSQKTDGIILSSMFFESDYLAELIELDIPYIMYNRRHKSGGNYVELDNYQAGKIATEYLIERGHKDILWIGGEQEKSTFIGRFKGFNDTMSVNNIEIFENRMLNIRQTPEKIKSALLESLHNEKVPTAILAATDMIAITVLDVLLSRGYRVPEDIAVIGIDNTELIQNKVFDLTSVGTVKNQSLSLIAIEQLINAIENNKQVNHQQTLPCIIYERGTV